MNRIYKNASHVLVWMGLDDQAMAEPAFKLVRELDEIYQDEEKREKFRIDHTDYLEERSKDPWFPLTHVTHLPWVSRAEAIHPLRILLVVIRLTCPMHVIYARHAYVLPTLHPKKNQASINQQRIRIATQ